MLKDGSLVDFFTNFIFSGKAGGFTTNLEYSRSTNGGNSWSKPVVVSDMQAVGTVDPNTGVYIRAADSLFDIAYDPSNGAVYAVCFAPR